MVDLTTTYLGFNLAHPIMPSASPLSSTVDGMRRLEDAGAPAVVMPSLFEEQLEMEALVHLSLTGYEHAFGEALTYFPDLSDYNAGPDHYLDALSRAKMSLDIPIIASLNGASPGGWTEYARLMAEAGADALELNLYQVPANPDLSGAEVEEDYLEVVREVRAVLDVPLAVKLSPFFSAPAHMARRLADAGADGLVLFNRFYQPDFDLELLEVVPHLVLSESAELRLPLRWIALLHGRVEADLALTTGIHQPGDVLKALMAGASVAMTASELLKHGLGRIEDLRVGVEMWLEEHEYVSVAQMQGSMSQASVADPTAFERAQYIRMLSSW